MATKQTFKWTDYANSSSTTTSVKGGFTYDDEGPATIRVDPATGAGAADVQSTGNSGVAQTTPQGNDPSGQPYDNQSEMRMGLRSGQSVTTNINFDPDSTPADPAKPEVEVTNVDFRILRLENGQTGVNSATSRSAVTIKAYDADGNLVPISVTAGNMVDVTTNADGSVVVTGKLASGSSTGTRNWGDQGYPPFTSTAIARAEAVSALIQIAGPVARIEVTATYTGTNTNGNAYPTMTDINYWSEAVVCFVAGTLIETDQGLVAVEDLQEGMMVLTRDEGFQPVRWTGQTRLSLIKQNNVRPIRIKAGALGDGIPSADLLVSPQHRILVRSAIAHRMFGTNEVLVAAKQLLQLDGIDIADDMDAVTYVHFMFDRHQIVLSNGAETESLYTGPEAIKSVGAAARREIFAIFPELRDRDYMPEPVRHLASGRMARKLAVRHAQNLKPLVS
ncbi:MAG: Hint domain-containing protein [Paracoccus sp. (in: a-proteobacteria)]|uniref:Hint domain-containing protein n=1 Tax=Paracoccus sp. TaxID=267 RepID=UPI0026E0171D|nr:Hint domain-containing protein [Paracoccus sp. (in: a-proteobacteria)]MDO5630508.1 Hint domain-containing protein [Paracoccus sp. (in: a-proteobacteria)]